MKMFKLTKAVDRRIERIAQEVRGIEAARAEIAAKLETAQGQRITLAEAAHSGDAKARKDFDSCEIAAGPT